MWQTKIGRGSYQKTVEFTSSKLDGDDVADHLYQREIISFGEIGNINDTDDLGEKEENFTEVD